MKVTAFVLGIVLALSSGCGTMTQVDKPWDNNLYVVVSDKNELRASIKCDQSSCEQFRLISEKSKLFKGSSELPITVEQNSDYTGDDFRISVKLKDDRIFKKGDYVLQICSKNNGAVQIDEASFKIKTSIITPFSYFQDY